MALRIELLVLVFWVRITISSAYTNGQDLAALLALTQGWGNQPSTWSGSDPCSSWAGISCTNGRITSIILSSFGVTGQLTGDLASLSELTTLDLSYNAGLTGKLPTNIGQLGKLQELALVDCGFSGQIPDSIGSLLQLSYLSLNSNGFTGNIPPSIGNLTKLYWLDMSDNQLSGSIPVSNATTLGLDMLVNTKHFHFGQNKFSGTIPPTLFSSQMTLLHVLFDNNQLTGGIPSTVGLVQSLEAVRFNGNSLTGNVPSNISNITSLQVLILSNNQLGGPIPDLAGLSNINYVDLSNNTFDVSDVPPWFSSLGSLTTLMMEHTQVQGELPVTLFSFSNLQTVVLKNNRLNGTLSISSSYSNQLELVDLQNNDITEFTPKAYNFTLILVGNPFCLETGTTGSYCTVSQKSESSASSYSTPANNCLSPDCSSGQVSSPNCKCAYPYTGTILFKAPTFSDIGNVTYELLEKSLIDAFTRLYLPVDSVSLRNIPKDSLDYLGISLEVFPSGEVSFNITTISLLGFLFSNHTYSPPSGFGPYTFLADKYTVVAGPKKSSHVGIIIGVAVACVVLLLLLLFFGWRAYHQKKRAASASHPSNSFGSWGPSVRNSDIPQLKGARWFSFEEIKKCTNNFSEANNVGSGGYGKVYKGVLPEGQLVAVKRAQVGSLQGTGEFKTEIELLSRVHHKNLVNLLGFCLDMGEQMLVYEFLPNGSLMDSLTGKSGVRLDWVRRMRVALGSARGLAYLHELADPPIIHRDIKSNNILLGERLTAKVADFGLSKPFGDDDHKGYVTTQVKGTMGYLDPEYYMTQQLTEKSDVYSFGVVMLELVSGRRPIQEGKYIVREFKSVLDKTKDLYNLQGLIDPAITSDTITLVGFEKFVDLALSCVDESGPKRPTMSEVVKGLDSILLLAGLNPNADSAPTSGSYAGSSAGNIYGDDSLFIYSGSVPFSMIEPK
ncbi:Leucine-rich repeat receptor protein kinase HPCA1-like protein [Drosera capensis]